MDQTEKAKKIECLYNYIDNLMFFEDKRVNELKEETNKLSKRIKFINNYIDNIQFFKDKSMTVIEKNIKDLSNDQVVDSRLSKGYIYQYSPRTLDLIYHKTGYTEEEILDIRIDCINQLMSDLETERNNLQILKEDLANGTHKLQIMDLKQQVINYTELLNEKKNELRNDSENKKSIKLAIARLNMHITSLKETIEYYEKQDKELEMKMV